MVDLTKFKLNKKKKKLNSVILFKVTLGIT